MPPGIPVATVGIDNARNAAMLAAQIIALSDEAVAQAIELIAHSGTPKTVGATGRSPLHY